MQVLYLRIPWSSGCRRDCDSGVCLFDVGVRYLLFGFCREGVFVLSLVHLLFARWGEMHNRCYLLGIYMEVCGCH